MKSKSAGKKVTWPLTAPSTKGGTDMNDLANLSTKLPTIETERQDADFDRDLVKQIAMDIGKEVVAYIEVMYPQAITATSNTFKLSVRNCIYNEIMAALEVSDADEIPARLDARKKFRWQWTKTYRDLRENKNTPS